MIATAGAAFTTTVIAAVARLPPASMTVAVMVCVPERSVAMSSRPPEPSEPSRLERQAIAAARLPSSRSSAVPTNVIVSPGTKLAPPAGAVTAIVGAAFTTTVRVAAATLPRPSVTVAVIVCVPEWSAEVPIVPPVPSGPSRLDLQTIDGA